MAIISITSAAGCIASISARSRAAAPANPESAVYDLGPQLAIWFTDPDGMSGEVCWTRDHTLVGFHAPVPLPVPAG